MIIINTEKLIPYFGRKGTMFQKIEAKVLGVFMATEKGSFITEERAEVQVEFGGIPGDLHFGLTKKAGEREPMYEKGTEIFNRRQISIVSAEECAEVAQLLKIEEVLPEWLGANLIVEGIDDFTLLKEGSRIVFPSGATLLCEGINHPCIHPGKVIQSQYPGKKIAGKFVKMAYDRRGIVCIVEKPGIIKKGDKAVIHSYEPFKGKVELSN